MSNNPPGVPTLQDNGITWDDVQPVDSDGPDVTENTTIPQWGIFDQNGNPVLVGDSTISFDYTRDSSVAEYPVEQGGFESYNKVQRPFDVKFTFTQGGTVSDRTDFLNACEVVQNSLALYTAMTPERFYSGITVDHVDYRRTAKAGVTLIAVDVWCKEIRTAPALQFSQTDTSTTPTITNGQDPGSDATVNGGTVSGSTPAQQSMSATTFSGAINSALSSPATITAPGISLTNSVGNTTPPSFASAIQSQITYTTPSGPQSGVISGVTQNSGGQPISYTLGSGPTIPVNEVTNIAPPGYTVVQ